MINNIMNLSVIMSIFTLITIQAKEEMPLSAASGQCFTKAFYPPKIKKTIKTTSTKRVKLSESTVKYKVIPAQHIWQNKKFKISDGTEKIIVTPATYKNISKKILLTAAEKTWKKNLNVHSKKAHASCVQAANYAGLEMKNTNVGTCYYEHFQRAQYRTINEKILTAEATTKIITIPATYKTVRKKIETSSSTMKLTPVAIKYKKVKEDITIAPAKTEWRKTTCQNRGCAQSEVVCLVEVPRTFKTITKKVILEPAIAKEVTVAPVYKYINVQELVSPATTKVISIPAQYKSIQKTQKTREEKYFWTDSSLKNAKSRISNQCDKICLVERPAIYKNVITKVIVNPASSKKVSTPSKYTNIKIKKVMKEAAFKTITVPAEYTEIRVEREFTKGYSKWMPMVCESAMVPSLVKKIQQALKYQGYYHGEIDGTWDLEEKSAVRSYQKANKLAVTKLSIETMKSLGIY